MSVQENILSHRTGNGREAPLFSAPAFEHLCDPVHCQRWTYFNTELNPTLLERTFMNTFRSSMYQASGHLTQRTHPQGIFRKLPTEAVDGDKNLKEI